jgi:hypothetical protein
MHIAKLIMLLNKQGHNEIHTSGKEKKRLQNGELLVLPEI